MLLPDRITITPQRTSELTLEDMHANAQASKEKHAAELERDRRIRIRNQTVAAGLAVGAVILGSFLTKENVVCKGEQRPYTVSLTGLGAGDLKQTVEVPDGDWVAFDDMPGEILRTVDNQDGQSEQKHFPLKGALYPGDIIINLPTNCETE